MPAVPTMDVAEFDFFNEYVAKLQKLYDDIMEIMKKPFALLEEIIEDLREMMPKSMVQCGDLESSRHNTRRYPGIRS